MIINTLRGLFKRDLENLKKEIGLYQSEANLWVIEAAISNSAGNLCLHLIGNLNTYIGAEFGKTGYIRDRDLEFSQKDVPQATLLAKIEDTIAVVDLALSQLSQEQLQADYPQEVFAGKTMTTE